MCWSREKESWEVRVCVKALSHGGIFLATCNACNSTFGRCKIGKYMFPSQFANIFLTYQTFVTNLHLLIKSRIAFQVARKIAPCDRALRGQAFLQLPSVDINSRNTKKRYYSKLSVVIYL